MKNPGEEYKYLIYLYWNSGWEVGFSGGSVVRNLPANAVDTSLIPGLGRSAERNGNPLQYSCLGNQMDKGACWATVRGVTKKVGYNLMTKQQAEICRMSKSFQLSK